MNGSGMTHEARLALAGRLKDLILDRYGELVLAVFVTSSTARGLDLAFSDLELTAVHRDSSSAASQSYYYRGVLVEVEHIEESRILERARTVDHSWPVKAGGYRDRIQLFERDGWMQQLDEVLSARDAGDFMRAQRSAMLTLREDMDKLRNARLMGDDLNVRVFGFFTAYNAANIGSLPQPACDDYDAYVLPAGIRLSGAACGVPLAPREVAWSEDGRGGRGRSDG